MAHLCMTKACLLLGKHVLVEKPMMMSVSECDEVIILAANQKKILNVVHSFQFSNGIIKLDKLIKRDLLGKISSILEIQYSNRDRRLPKWYNELPLGLFYDEAAHFFYSAIRFGGDLKIDSVNVQKSKIEGNTPCHMSVQAYAGNTPLQMYMNFDAPVCEWHLYLMGAKKMAIYDYFKDILILIDNDKQHLALDILRTSFQYSLGYWIGFINNGLRMLTGNLLYGHDKVIKEFTSAIISMNNSPFLSAELGKKVIIAMNNVIELAGGKL